jgi:hypothetical protein
VETRESDFFAIAAALLIPRIFRARASLTNLITIAALARLTSLLVNSRTTRVPDVVRSDDPPMPVMDQIAQPAPTAQPVHVAP